MQDNHLFEYAVIRVVPRVEREEFFNVGVILYCAAEKFLQVSFQVDEKRLRAFCQKLDIDELKDYLTAIEKICNATEDSGPIGKFPLAERFRWLTATRSTIVQTSKVHPGLCTNAKEMLQHLYTQLVL